MDLCKEAKELGAAYALVVAPGYYRAAMSDTVLEEYFTEVRSLSDL